MRRAKWLVFLGGLVAAAMVAAGSAPALKPVPTLPAVATPPGLIEAFVLLHWGYGALDWLIPHDNGDRDERKQRRRT